MGISFSHLIVVLVIVIVLFGVGKLPNVMGDIGKGIKNFKDGLGSKPDEGANTPPKQIAPDDDKLAK